MRRGLVAIGGNAGGEAGRAMIAGTLVVLGSVAAHAGRGSKRGSIVAAGAIEVPPTYRYACTFEPTYVRFLMTYLSRQHGLPIEPRIAGGRYRRYCGDAGGTGRGEILILE
jgi:formylmethanofuran dehydrogenase subunit C